MVATRPRAAMRMNRFLRIGVSSRGAEALLVERTPSGGDLFHAPGNAGRCAGWRVAFEEQSSRHGGRRLPAEIRVSGFSLVRKELEELFARAPMGEDGDELLEPGVMFEFAGSLEELETHAFGWEPPFELPDEAAGYSLEGVVEVIRVDETRWMRLREWIRNCHLLARQGELSKEPAGTPARYRVNDGDGLAGQEGANGLGKSGPMWAGAGGAGRSFTVAALLGVSG